MNTQRFIIAIIAIIGLIATFLPWFRIGHFETYTGMASTGWFTFIMFLIILFLTFLKRIRRPLTMGLAAGVTILGLLAAFVVLWKMVDVFFAKENMVYFDGRTYDTTITDVFVGYGAWIVVIAGICICFVAYLYKNRRYEH